MRATLAIALKDLRLRLRDKSFFIVGLLAPFGLAFVFNLIVSPVAEGAFHPQYAVVQQDTGVVGAGFVGMLEEIESGGFIGVTTDLGEADARAQVESGDLDAAFILPAGLTEAVESGRAAAVEVVGSAGAPTSAEIARSITEGFAARVSAAQLAVVTVAAGNPALDPAQVSALATEAAQLEPAVSLGGIEASNRQMDLPTYFIAGMAVFFLFFTVQIGVTSLLEEQQAGTMTRLLAAPISSGAITAAKALTSFVMGVIAMTVLAVASTYLMGARWGNPLGVALLIVTGVAAATGVMAVVAGIARTAESAASLQSIFAVTLGALGGVFFPVSQGPGFLASLSLFTPHAWFLRGLGDLAGGAGAGAVLPAAGALLAFGVVTGTAGAVLLRRKVSR